MTTAQPIPSIPIIPLDREIDLAVRVDAARKAKGNSPFVGIATSKGTIMLRRDVLKKSLRGLRIIEAEIITSNENGMIRGHFQDDANNRAHYRSNLAIRVYAVGERVKAGNENHGGHPENGGLRKWILLITQRN